MKVSTEPSTLQPAWSPRTGGTPASCDGGNDPNSGASQDMNSTVFRRICLGAAILAYLGFLYSLVLVPTVPAFGHVRPFNLVPFRTIVAQLTDPNVPFSHRAYELVGNVLLMTPFGALLALTRRRLSLVAVALVSAGLASTIEILQYVLRTWRVADIDDVILNTSGAILGYLIVHFLITRYADRQRGRGREEDAEGSRRT